ncbi:MULTISPECIES: elongation factor P 5-aminopentanone reductase [Aneurinibacillus]|jgi:3-oxoacyl-[acyl-carrier protein] reductase|uniref:Putative oxidoreductase YmfI n=1 Tax=Aneurinibacillus danicus TaxID=267746 RepID=A0A511VAN7_9BACL|nr:MULTISPECIES: 3-oxoacyl-ACP reductase FabG [Aneurinibacillus]GEN34292.1 putative oxidoreductase YmfI [Aneurinibacillus danicus]
MRQQRYACVTGASRGIGAAIALRLARAGYNLTLHYNSSVQEAEEVAKRCGTEGAEVTLVRADLTAPDGAEQLYGQLLQAPDVLVLNAGLSAYGMVQDVTTEEWEKMMNVHVRAPFFCARLALPHMVRRRFGRIITVSSIWGLTGASFEVLYSTAKGAVISFTKALAKEVAPSGITVNCIAPGLIRTEMMTGAFNEEELAAIVEEIPAGRMGTPEEIAALAAFLAGDEAGYINGQIISPNGAWYC